MRLLRGWLTHSASVFWPSVLLPVYCLLGCCISTDGGEGTAANRQALQIWKEHENRLRDAIEGWPRSDEVCEPCAFFQQVAGIQVHVNFFTLGYVPGSEAKDDLKRIQAWYRKNHRRLYWNEATGTVKVRPEPSER